MGIGREGALDCDGLWPLYYIPLSGGAKQHLWDVVHLCALIACRRPCLHIINIIITTSIMIKIWAPDTHHVLTKSPQRKSQNAPKFPGSREQKWKELAVCRWCLSKQLDFIYDLWPIVFQVCDKTIVFETTRKEPQTAGTLLSRGFFP